MKFALLDAEKAKYPIKTLCRALGVSRSGYYAWRKRQPSLHAVEDSRLSVLVREAHERSRRTYGSPRIHAELRAHHVFVSRKRVIRLMQRDGLIARQRKRYRSTTTSEHDQPIAPNLLARRFDAERPNQRRCLTHSLSFTDRSLRTEVVEVWPITVDIFLRLHPKSRESNPVK